jgi:hypothetical protein
MRTTCACLKVNRRVDRNAVPTQSCSSERDIPVRLTACSNNDVLRHSKSLGAFLSWFGLRGPACESTFGAQNVNNAANSEIDVSRPRYVEQPQAVIGHIRQYLTTDASRMVR